LAIEVSCNLYDHSQTCLLQTRLEWGLSTAVYLSPRFCAAILLFEYTADCLSFVQLGTTASKVHDRMKYMHSFRPGGSRYRDPVNRFIQVDPSSQAPKRVSEGTTSNSARSPSLPVVNTHEVVDAQVSPAFYVWFLYILNVITHMCMIPQAIPAQEGALYFL
jgi:hypothetical protein